MFRDDIYSRGVFEVNSEHIKNDTKVLIAISTSFLLCTLFSKDHCSVVKKSYNLVHSVKLGFKERIDSEHLGNSEPLPATNLPVYFINSEQPGISEQCYDSQKVSYYQVRLYVCMYYHSLIHGFEFCHQNHGPITTNCCGKVKNYASENVYGGTIWEKRPSEP